MLHGRGDLTGAFNDLLKSAFASCAFLDKRFMETTESVEELSQDSIVVVFT